MNFQQLEYVVAVDDTRHFQKAADRCHVTQATLSAMIKKLEEELQLRIFDRSRVPVTTTPEGVELVLRAKQILSSYRSLFELAKELRGELTGTVTIGIIPTLAPYLIPLFLGKFIEGSPKLEIQIMELTSHEIVQRLSQGQLDIGLMATPTHWPGVTEVPLFQEELMVYTSRLGGLANKPIARNELTTRKFWLLEEGHCLRNQAINFCSLHELQRDALHVHYKVGSIEALVHLVDKMEGVTIIPFLATLYFNEEQLTRVRHFRHPKPVREISMVTSVNYPRKAIMSRMQADILEAVLPLLQQKKKSAEVVSIGLIS